MYRIRESYRHLPRIKRLHLIHMTCLWMCQTKYTTVVFYIPYRRHMMILFVYLHGFLHNIHINVHGIFTYVYTYITPIFLH